MSELYTISEADSEMDVLAQKITYKTFQLSTELAEKSSTNIDSGHGIDVAPRSYFVIKNFKAKRREMMKIYAAQKIGILIFKTNKSISKIQTLGNLNPRVLEELIEESNTRKGIYKNLYPKIYGKVSDMFLLVNR